MRDAFYTVLAAAVLFASAASRAAAPIRVMLVDGESAGTYHKWQATTPVLEKELDETGLFQVDVVTAPPPGASFGWQAMRRLSAVAARSGQPASGQSREGGRKPIDGYRPLRGLNPSYGRT